MAVFKPVLLLFFFFSSAASATVIPYLSEGDWLAALSSVDILEEGFDGNAASFSANTINNKIGSISVSLLGGTGDPGPTGLTGKGFFQGEVDSKGKDKLALDISFGDVYGFALAGLQNDSYSKPADLALADIAIGIGADYWVLEDLVQQHKSSIPFLGFVSDESFDAFSFLPANTLTGKGGTSEEFYLDQLVLARVSTVAVKYSGGSVTVPEPPVWVLILVGLLACVRSKKFFVVRSGWSMA